MPHKNFADIITLTLGPAEIYALPLPEKTDRTSSRQAEKVAVAHLIAQVFGCEITLHHTSDGAPYITDSNKHISISHGGGYALLAVNNTHPIGVDIEAWRPQLQRVAERFLSPSERDIYSRSESLLLHAWTAKEAIFKALGISNLTISEIALPQNPDTATFICHGKNVTLYRSSFGNSMITLAITSPL